MQFVKIGFKKFRTPVVDWLWALENSIIHRKKIKELGWLNMNKRRDLHLAVFVHNLQTSSSPPYNIANKLIMRSQMHSVNVRNKSSLTNPIRDPNCRDGNVSESFHL